MGSTLVAYKHALITHGSHAGDGANQVQIIAAIARHHGVPPEQLTEDHATGYATARGVSARSASNYRGYLRRYAAWRVTGDATPRCRRTGHPIGHYGAEFADWLTGGYRGGKYYAHSTAVTYLTYIGSCGAHAGVHPAHLKAHHVRAYLAELDRRGRTYPYINKVRSALVAWGEYTGIDGIDAIARKNEKERCNPRRPRPVRDHVLAAMMAAATPRERVMLLLGAQCGMRAHEIAKAAWEDFTEPGADDPGGPVIVHIEGKGRRLRDIEVDAAIYAQITALLPAGRGPLFPGMPARAGNRVNVELSELAHRCGYTITSHQLRHWFASKAWIVTGENLLAVRDLLGHSSATVTEAYIEDLTRDNRAIARGMAAMLPGAPAA